MDTLDFSLMNEFQRDFPVCARPFQMIAARLGSTESDVLARLSVLRARGAVSRIGATLVPGRLGAATLAALAVPPRRVNEIASIVNAYPEVNHNYERDHRYNLWFVVTAPARARVQEVLREIEQRAQCGRVLDLPMRTAFHLDLAFDLRSAGTHGASERGADADDATALSYTRGALSGDEGRPYTPSAEQARVLAALQDGIAFTPRPYIELAARAGASERRVIATLEHLLAERVIRRIGVIVSHRDVGYRANAMAVWNVPDHSVRAAGVRLARQRGVALCYVRERDLPGWPYNLYCMVHGRHRETVIGETNKMAADSGLTPYPGALLFSTQRFKQCAARYVEEGPHERDGSADRECVAG